MTVAGAYPLNRKRTWISLAGTLFGGLLFLGVGLAIAGPWRWLCLLVAFACGAALVVCVRLLLDRRPILRISAEGLYYRPFADRAVPWSEITRMAHILGYTRSVVWGRTMWLRAPSADQLNFDIANPRLYPNHPGRALSRAVQSMGGAPPIVIQLWFVRGDAEAIFAEIAKYWPGAIVRIEQRPGTA